ncbi:MAG: hypothetical protein LBQ88_08745 [Treponema sp.]|jgi:hypothetical protein|nr:hypothetical protein [Treponema sp.]
MYFEKPGPEHTRETLELGFAAVRERNIGHIVFATSTGTTAKAVLEMDFASLNVVCVTHACGYAEDGHSELPDNLRRDLEESGIKVLSTTHVLSGVERGLQRKFGGIYPAEIMAYTLRMLGAGVKVCAEISIMALDAGLIPHGQPVVAVGGTHRGADTALIISPAHAFSVFDTKIHEVICKPL